ncbi:MAG: hypothetical protein JW891_16850 [Candidatus Lokiarchaeota archaeon]|nr:hypothetical protein [Candidatus Lokiarchaeota archaeon]
MEDLLEIREESAEKNRTEPKLKKMFEELATEDNEAEKVLSDLFYNSVKMVFDTGFDLAKALNEELLAEFFNEEE